MWTRRRPVNLGTAHLASRVSMQWPEPALPDRRSWLHALPFPVRAVLRRWRGLVGMVVGVDGDPSDIPNTIVMRSGRWLSRSDDLVVGAKLAREKRFALGDTVRLAERDFSIVGIGRLRGVGYGSDGLAYMDYRTLRQR